LRDWGWLTPTIVGAVIVALFIVGELIFFRPLTPINDKASGIDLAPAPPQNGLAPIQTAPIFTAPIETAPVTVAPIEPPPINPAPIVQPDVDDVLNSLRGRRPRESAPAPAPNAGTRSTARGRGAPPTDILNSESELIERACAGCHPATLVRNYAMRRGADQPTRQDFENLLAQENARGAGLTDTEVSRLLNWFSRLRTLNMRGGRGAAPCIIAPDENCTVTP
jgi:hypothetical protein